MKKIGLFYATATTKTTAVAKKIQEAFGKEAEIDLIPVEKAWNEDFQAYDNLILGVATWFDGELPSYWDELRPELETLTMKNKKVAIFGLGDQKRYPDNFVDGVGILAEIFEKRGAALVGFTSPKGYLFAHSKAVRNKKFAGLVIDFENQSGETKSRIQNWVEQLKSEFK